MHTCPHGAGIAPHGCPARPPESRLFCNCCPDCTADCARAEENYRRFGESLHPLHDPPIAVSAVVVPTLDSPLGIRFPVDQNSPGALQFLNSPPRAETNYSASSFASARLRQIKRRWQWKLRGAY